MPGFRPRFFVSATGLPLPEGSADHDHGLCGAELALSPGDSYHAQRVLRLAEGYECEVVVGAAVYAATVCAAADPAAPAGPVRVRLAARLEGEEAGAAYRTEVGLVQALVRPAVMDYVLEKGTEVGASFFVLVPTAGSPRQAEAPRAGRLARWRRIVLEAAKQSKQVAVPPVTALRSIEEALRDAGASETLSLVLEPSATAGLEEILARRIPRPARLALWVGPEGGWTAAEVGRFSSAGLETVRLGRSVLRTETAGPVAVAVARLALGDW